MSCARCHALCTDQPIGSPTQLRAALARAAGALRAGVLEGVHPGHAQEVLDLAGGEPWGDIVDLWLRCRRCGQPFQLAAETYHGAGGGWVVMEACHRALAFHDSEVRGIVPSGTDLVLTFSAAVVHRHGAEAGYLAGLPLVFRDARWSGDLAGGQGRLSTGELRIEGDRLTRIFLPLDAGPAEAELRFATGAVLAVQASAVACRPTGNEPFRESYAC